MTIKISEVTMNLYKSNIIAVNMQGEPVNMSNYKGKVLVIVNTASKCGFTPQLEGLQKLYEKFKDDDVIILGFPCNQFNNQDPGTNEEIKSFCQINYGVTFPMFQKIEVNGENRHPLYEYLISYSPVKTDADIKWTYKFLVDRDGNV